MSHGRQRTLKILSAKETDYGTYGCETSDGRNRTEGELVVKADEPSISTGPQDLTVSKLGTDAKLHCEFTRPPHKVLWYKNGQEIWPQSDKFVTFEKNDIGEYCAALSEKEVSAPAQLKLEVAPEIVIQENLEDELVFKAHEELAFHVEVTGHPTPIVTILHKDSRIQNRAEVEEYDNVVSVRMKNLSRDDCGTVKITAENPIGATHKELSLTVLDVPSEPLGLTSAETSTNSTILSWHNPEKANGAPITGFIIERKAVDSNRWRPIGKTNATTLQFEATDLFSGLVYVFRVIAVNSVGEGPPSQSVDVLTKEDEESNLDSSESSLLETPSPPEAVFDGAKVMLSWSAVPDANAYQLERQCDAGDWLEIAKVESTNFADSSLLQQGSYCYRVIAKGSAAESMPSGSSAALVVHADVSQGKDKGKHVGKKEAEGESDPKELEVSDERQEELPKPVSKKPLNPVDDIVNTKQRLKKRKPVENERRSSIQQNVDEMVTPSPSEIIKTKEELEEGEAEVTSKLGAEHQGNLGTEEAGKKPSTSSEPDAGAHVPPGGTAATAPTDTRGKPCIQLESNRVEVKSGESTTLKVNVTGGPELKCVWRKNGKIVKVVFSQSLDIIRIRGVFSVSLICSWKNLIPVNLKLDMASFNRNGLLVQDDAKTPTEAKERGFVSAAYACSSQERNDW
ncbi:fibronectin type III domain protein [Cooperia oncophora]